MRFCAECGRGLTEHPYARHADDSPVLVCAEHGIRDSATTVQDRIAAGAERIATSGARRT